MKLPEGKSRLDMVKAGFFGDLPRTGRFVVSIDRLIEDPENERKTFTNMDDMIESVRRHGIIEPITVTPIGEHYMIHTGHRRFRAAVAIGLTQVEVMVRDPEDDSARRIKSLVSNIQRENLPALELAETLRALLDEGTVPTQRELAHQLGKSEQWLSSTLRLLELPDGIKDRLRNPAVHVGYEMAQRIAQVDEPGLQEELVQAALAGENTRSVRHRISAYRADHPERAEPRKKTSAIIQHTLRHGSCIASLKARRAPQAREEMLTALRRLEQQVRDDDSLN